MSKLTLAIRTDQPVAELWLFRDQSELAHVSWEAHRELSSTLLTKVRGLLDAQGYSWSDVQSLAVFAGPGSFTGLRIGHSFANALAYANSSQIVNATGDSWLEDSLVRISQGETQSIIVPDYGRAPRITTPRK